MQSILKLINKRVVNMLCVAFIVTMLMVSPSSALAAATFFTGDLMLGSNVTRGTGTWTDPVTGSGGNLIEYNFLVKNNGDTTANNVKVTASIPTNTATSLTVTATATGDGMSSASDTETVTVEGGVPQSLALVTSDGHTRLCRSSGCTNVAATVTTSGIVVGSLAPGESAQVLFKTFLSNNVFATPTPTPTATVTATPSPTPTTATPIPSPTATPMPNTNQCPAGFILQNVGNQNVCVSQSQTVNVTATGGSSSSSSSSSSTATNNNTNTITTGSGHVGSGKAPVVVGTAVAPVKELPKTGLPLAALPLLGLVPAGLKFRKFGSTNTGDLSESPLSLWEKRQTFKS